VVYGVGSVPPTLSQIIDGMTKAQADFFNNDSFLIRCSRTRCEEVTRCRFSGGYTNVEFIVANKDACCFTSKKFIVTGIAVFFLLVRCRSS
jgi:hypothetical protein